MIAGGSDAVIRGLIKAGALEAAEVSVDTLFPVPDPDFAPPELNDAQEAAARELIHAVRARDFQPFLLDALNGSGKTEAYFKAIAQPTRLPRHILITPPEIALPAPLPPMIDLPFCRPPRTRTTALPHNAPH